MADTAGNMFYRGEWVFCKEYSPGDVVQRGGELYLSIKQSAGEDPADPLNSEYWMLMMAKVDTPKQHNELEGLQGGGTNEYYHVLKDHAQAILKSNSPGTDNPFLTVADMPALEKRVAAFKLKEAPEGIGTLYAAAFGDGVFVAVGDNTAVTSTDGENWIRRAITNGYMRGVAYGGGVFAAVGLGGRAMYSEDGGETWTDGVAPDGDWNALAFGNGMFVAVSDGKIMFSADGKTGWSARDVPDGYGEAICFGNGVFTAIGPKGAMTSLDGVNWTEHETPTGTWRCGTYGIGMFMALAGKCMTSTDGGETWEASVLPSGGWDAVCHGGGFFVAVGNSAQRIVTGDSGLVWEQTAAPNFVWRGLAFGLGMFVAVGGGIMAAKVVDVAAALNSADSPNADNPFVTSSDLNGAKDALEADITELDEKQRDFKNRLDEYGEAIEALAPVDTLDGDETDKAPSVHAVKAAIDSIPISKSFYRGAFPDPAALRGAYPTDEPGAYATVLSTGTIWIWYMSDWVDSGKAQTEVEVVDNLTTDDGTKALSARQGKKLNEKIEGKSSAARINITIPGTGWIEDEEDTTGYPWHADVLNSVISSGMTPIYALRLDSLGAAIEAGVAPVCQTLDGALRVWAADPPEEALTGALTLLMPGGEILAEDDFATDEEVDDAIGPIWNGD